MCGGKNRCLTRSTRFVAGRAKDAAPEERLNVVDPTLET